VNLKLHHLLPTNCFVRLTKLLKKEQFSPNSARLELTPTLLARLKMLNVYHVRRASGATPKMTPLTTLAAIATMIKATFARRELSRQDPCTKM